MGEGAKLLEVLLRGIARISWPLVFNSSIAALSFSIVHYVFYMRYFGGELLLLYPSEFYFQFAFLLFLHVAVATFLGNIAFYSANYAVIVVAEDILQLREVKSWRAFKFRLHKVRRRKYPKMMSIGLLSAFFLCLTYLGILRAVIFFLVLVLVLFGLSFQQEHKAMFTRVFLTIGRKRSERMFTVENFVRAFDEMVKAPRWFRKELLRIGSTSLIAVAAPVILISAAASGYLRAGNVADNIELFVTKDHEVYSGVIYASASNGVLIYDKSDGVGIFLPAGSFTARTK